MKKYFVVYWYKYEIEDDGDFFEESGFANFEWEGEEVTTDVIIEWLDKLEDKYSNNRKVKIVIFNYMPLAA